jgi:hypothetical protein
MGGPPNNNEFYSEDRVRLDSLFVQFQKFKENEQEHAIQVLEEFKAGLEHHMAWEDDNSAVDLNSDQQQLRDCHEVALRIIQAKDTITTHDELHLLHLLVVHNRDEEASVYRELNEVLTNHDRSAIRQRMNDSALT